MKNDIARGWRKAAVYKEYLAGVPRENIAEHFEIDIDTVNTYIRESKMEEAEGADRGSRSFGESKYTIAGWLRKMLGREVLTVEGKATLAEVYPFIVRTYGRMGYRSYTHGEIYYINQGLKMEY